MEKIFLLTDYKGRFGSRHDDSPYRSGMNLQVLTDAFRELGLETEIMPFSSVNPGDSSWRDRLVVYTSAEDPGFIYKQYIEDVVLALSNAGAKVIPRFEYLRANNDKVFMELLRSLLPENLQGNLESSHFATLEEVQARADRIGFPVVIKGHSGAMGRNVFLAHDQQELKRTIKRKIAVRSSFRLRIKEYLRQVIHKGYQRDSFYRGRFIIQKFIPGLKNDWKVYYFGEKAFVFNRPVFARREFRASGGGYDNYKYGSAAGAPEGMLDFGWQIFRELLVPNISIDIAWDGSRFYMLEFQCLYFGTAGILQKYSKEYFLKDGREWRVTANDGNIEKTYAESVSWFIRKIG